MNGMIKYLPANEWVRNNCSMGQMQLFTRAETTAMRDRTRARNYSPEKEAFRRDHERRRAWENNNATPSASDSWTTEPSSRTTGSSCTDAPKTRTAPPSERPETTPGTGPWSRQSASRPAPRLRSWRCLRSRSRPGSGRCLRSRPGSWRCLRLRSRPGSGRCLRSRPGSWRCLRLRSRSGSGRCLRSRPGSRRRLRSRSRPGSRRWSRPRPRSRSRSRPRSRSRTCPRLRTRPGLQLPQCRVGHVDCGVRAVPAPAGNPPVANLAVTTNLNWRAPNIRRSPPAGPHRCVYEPRPPAPTVFETTRIQLPAGVARQDHPRGTTVRSGRHCRREIFSTIAFDRARGSAAECDFSSSVARHTIGGGKGARCASGLVLGVDCPVRVGFGVGR
jgi:hypothetical protein